MIRDLLNIDFYIIYVIFRVQSLSLITHNAYGGRIIVDRNYMYKKLFNTRYKPVWDSAVTFWNYSTYKNKVC